MFRFSQPPPANFDKNSMLNWFMSVHESLGWINTWLVNTVTADTTLTQEHEGLILAANTGDITLTLPAVATVGPGFKIIFIKSTVDAKKVTLDGNASETINGSATNAEMDAQYDRIGIVSDGTQWFIWERSIA